MGKSVLALCLLVVLPALIKGQIAAYVCEGEKMTLGCDTGTLQIISANFGRTLNTICTRYSNVHNTNCRYDGSLTKVRSLCQSKKFCTLEASIPFFNGIDPCPGTYKYIAMDYVCR